jgi:chromate reductase, NAD(P)H dehydrogenase (quinone)
LSDQSEPRPSVRVLAVAGSLRAGSYNRALVRAARELAPPGVEVEEFDLRPLPPYDADVEAAGDPEWVARFKRAIRDAGALLIATPEYNRGTSGVLKNALDWASRPALAPPLAGKLVGMMGASAGLGGTARAQQQVRDALAFSRARVLDEPRILVPSAYEKFDAQGRLIDDVVRKQVADLVRALVGATAEVRAA